VKFRYGQHAGHLGEAGETGEQPVRGDIENEEFPGAHFGDVEPVRGGIDALVICPAGRRAQRKISDKGEETSESGPGGIARVCRAATHDQRQGHHRAKAGMSPHGRVLRDRTAKARAAAAMTAAIASKAGR
jgi:hypothetical protein